MFTTLISVDELHAHLQNPDWIVVDCRYDLMNKSAGRDAYLESHIAGAVFADVGSDLSGPPITDCGRHPLPSAEALIKLFSRLGIDADKQVVVYDAAGGAFAARLWWLLQYMGHKAVALLDGGWSRWTEFQLPTGQGTEQNSATDFSGTANSDWLVRLEQVLQAEILIDSRDPARYKGEAEPIDPAAGHIPGAINRFWQNNLEPSGLFKSSHILNSEFSTLYQHAGTNKAVFYCGSGVTACHNLLAVAHAGLAPARLYAGSWSEWCADPDRPVATGID